MTKKPRHTKQQLNSISAHLVQKQLTRHEVAALIRNTVVQAIDAEVAALDKVVDQALRSPAMVDALLKAGLDAGAAPRIGANWEGNGVRFSLDFEVLRTATALPSKVRAVLDTVFAAEQQKKRLKEERSAVREFRRDELALGLRVLLEQAPWAQGLRDEMAQLTEHFRAHMRKKA